MNNQTDLEKIAGKSETNYCIPPNSQYSPLHYLHSIAKTPLDYAFNQAVRGFEQGGPSYWMTDKMRSKKR